MYSICNRRPKSNLTAWFNFVNLNRLSLLPYHQPNSRAVARGAVIPERNLERGDKIKIFTVSINKAYYTLCIFELVLGFWGPFYFLTWIAETFKNWLSSWDPIHKATYPNIYFLRNFLTSVVWLYAGEIIVSVDHLKPLLMNFECYYHKLALNKHVRIIRIEKKNRVIAV